jgi:tetratricopeptide (TPR) repeat protein
LSSKSYNKGPIQLIRESPSSFRRLVAGAIYIAGAIGVFAPYFQIVRDNIEEYLIIVSGTAIVFILVGLYFIRYGQVTIPQSTGFTGGSQRREYLYSKGIRKAAPIITIFLVIIIGVGWYFWTLPTDKIVILVADFKGAEQDRYLVADTIIRRLREATREYSEVVVQSLRRQFTEQEGSTGVREIGKKRQATIVLWGYYGVTDEKVLATVYFEVIKPTYLRLEKNQETIITAVAELDRFNIQIQLADQMNYLALLTVGLIRFEENDYNGAIDRFNNAIGQSALPDQMINPAVVYFYRGLAFSFKDEIDNAIADYNQAIKLKPNWAVAHNNRANLYLSKGDFERALPDLDSAVALDPNWVTAHINRGIALVGKKDFDGAIAESTQAINLKPGPFEAEVYSNRGLAYDGKRDFAKAIADYDMAIALKPSLSTAYYNRGNTHSNMGDFGKAIADYSEALKLEPDYAEVYGNRGNVYMVLKDFDRAISDFTQEINRRPNYFEPYFNRALAWYIKNEFDKAIDDYTMVIKLKSDVSDAYHNRGSSYAKKGDFDRAIADYKQVISLEPNFADAYFNLGIAYAAKKDSKNAFKSFSKALELAGDQELKQKVMKHIEMLKTPS